MEDSLVRYLAPRLDRAQDVAISNLFRIPGGASRETWTFDASWADGGESRSAAFILRKDPPASLVESERELEYAFYQAFADSGVPVPRMRWLEPDPAHLGAPFFIMERITKGEANTRTILSPEFAPYHAHIARRMYEVLAEIHRFDWRDSPITKVIAPPAPEECWKRELGYWEGMINANEMTPQPVARAAIRWLRANPPPPPERVTVVHGDYRVGNFLYTRDEIHGVLDWEMAHLGDPLEDFAWSYMEMWEWARNGLKGGIVTAEDGIRMYEEASGRTVDRDALHWWDVFSGVKAQGIWLTGARSFQEGRTNELILAYTSWGLTNQQDEIILHSMGRGA